MNRSGMDPDEVFGEQCPHEEVLHGECVVCGEHVEEDDAD